jgi:tetratricopeptide (TPR) repeat protein
LPALLLLVSCRNTETALLRGDRHWADAKYNDALAEYRLAHDQRKDDEEILGRLAHAYIETGQFERAREHYNQLLEKNKDYTDQALFDYVTAARRARERSDRYGMAVAVEAALALRPGLPLDDMAAPLARYYASNGDADRALDFFERALGSASPDSVPALLYEMGELQERRSNCEESISLFNAYRSREPGGARIDQARWQVGNCSFQLGHKALLGGDYDEALRRFDVVIELGVPQNLLEQTFFERGDALLALGRRDEALHSFTRVLEVNRMRTGQWVDRAKLKIDQIRFGR